MGTSDVSLDTILEQSRNDTPRRTRRRMPIARELHEPMARPHIKSQHRVVRHGEVFTPPGLVNDMLDLVAHECERIDSRFLEPACGDGNFLAEVLRRKLLTVEKKNRRFRLKWERDAFLCLCSIYGIELLEDNAITCRSRLLTIVDDAHRRLFRKPLQRGAVVAMQYVLRRNIVHGDALDMKTLDKRPIVFSEWSPLNGKLIKRRDYAYEHLLDQASMFNMPLQSDSGKDAIIPRHVADFPPCEYLKVADAEKPAAPKNRRSRTRRGRP